MKRAEVKVGETYLAKVSGALAPVRITVDRGESYDWRSNKSRHLGWEATNTKTGRAVQIRSAQRLRRAATATTGEKVQKILAERARVRLLAPTATRCPFCNQAAIVPLSEDQLAAQPDETTHVCHPLLGGCNHGFAQEASS